MENLPLLFFLFDVLNEDVAKVSAVWLLIIFQRYNLVPARVLIAPVSLLASI